MEYKTTLVRLREAFNQFVDLYAPQDGREWLILSTKPIGRRYYFLAQRAVDGSDLRISEESYQLGEMVGFMEGLVQAAKNNLLVSSVIPRG